MLAFLGSLKLFQVREPSQLKALCVLSGAGQDKVKLTVFISEKLDREIVMYRQQNVQNVAGPCESS